jgi:hypothetical protein
VAGALPFVLYPARDINPLIFICECGLCLVWLAYACRTNIAARLSGLTFFDVINQTCVVPWCNFVAGFSVWRGLSRSGEGRSALHIGALLVGLVIAVPLAAAACMLLIFSDTAFSNFADTITSGFDCSDVVNTIAHIVYALPMALFAFGAVYGNARHRHEAHITSANAMGFLARLRRLPMNVCVAPLVVLVGLYIVYFVVMSRYLFSALGGTLPAGYTFAEYARQGFFELVAVVILNAAVLAGTYLFVRRPWGSAPVLLRILTGAFTVCTCLLIVTALSKMVLYVQAYDLSRLRLYVGWFMVMLLAVFVLVAAWHVHPFNVGRPVVCVAVACALALFCTNTDAIIANYNVDQYLARAAVPATAPNARIDVNELGDLSSTAAPALERLAASAPSIKVRERALQALGDVNVG